MHGKHATTCFKYQGVLYLYIEKTMTYLKSILVYPAFLEMLCQQNRPHTPLQATLPRFEKQHYLLHMEEKLGYS